MHVALVTTNLQPNNGWASLACYAASLPRPPVITACGSYIPRVAGRGRQGAS